LLFQFLQLLQQIVIAGRRLRRPAAAWRRYPLQDGFWGTRQIGEKRQGQAGHEKQRCQNSGGPRQPIGLATPRHEAAAADTECAALRTLQQNDTHERYDNHEMDDDQNGLHIVLNTFSLGTPRPTPRSYTAPRRLTSQARQDLHHSLANALRIVRMRLYEAPLTNLM
jgi:hypothetical protein